MNKLLLCVSLFLLLSCNNKKATTSSAKEEKKTKEFPVYVDKVLEAHGGLDLWSTMQSMSYVMETKRGGETQSIDLNDRREIIEKPDYSLGYDGQNYWTTADTSVKQSPVFYKNLIFYFYAMPFVIADDGIIFNEVPALEFDGKSYPGFRISYEPNIGVSPEDEYFIHYNPETNQMEWLGYTVTYFDQKKSTRISWRRYDDWTNVSGLKLPKSMLRMVSQENLPVSEKSRVNFSNIKVSKDAFADAFFKMEDGARVVTE